MAVILIIYLSINIKLEQIWRGSSCLVGLSFLSHPANTNLSVVLHRKVFEGDGVGVRFHRLDHSSLVLHLLFAVLEPLGHGQGQATALEGEGDLVLETHALALELSHDAWFHSWN